jgi:tRNA 2-thiocytidine biosynthesis protein TtcA
MLQEWDTLHPGRLSSIYRAMTDVVPSHLADRDLFDFAGLEERQVKQVKPLDVVNL